MKNIVIIGATSCIATHCARLWAQSESVSLTLVGRNSGKLQRLEQDLQVRSPESSITLLQGDFLSSGGVNEIVKSIAKDQVIDIVLIAHGSLPDQRTCEQDVEQVNDALQVNAVSPVLFAEAFAARLQEQGKGMLAVIGSVAGDRGRKSNYCYGAAKGLVERYVQGLQHRFANTAVKVTLIKPGPTDTPMTASAKAKGGRLAPVEQVAKEIVTGIDKNKPVIYAPKIWRAIMMVIRHLPRFVFDKMDV
jgi:hypothetical protein